MNESDSGLNDVDVLYQEHIEVGRLVKALVSTISILFIAMAVVFPILYLEFLLLSALLGMVTAIILTVYWNFRVLEITITKQEIIVKYGSFNYKKIPLTDVTGCECIKASLRRYGGVGVRKGTDGSKAYTTDTGDAVKVTPRLGKSFAFSTRRPNEVCQVVLKRIGQGV